MDKIWLKSYPSWVPERIDYKGFESIQDLFQKSVEKFADKKAATNMGHSLSFRELDRISTQFAAYLQQTLKLQKGDRIAIMMPNLLQYYVALYGALRAGLAVVNINPLYTARELTIQLKDSGATTVVVLANFAHVVEKALPDLDVKNVIVTEIGDMFNFPKKQLVNFVVKYIKHMVPSWHIPNAIKFAEVLKVGSNQTFQPVDIKSEDVAFLQYTGGTTGIPKGAILTHQNIVSNVLQAVTWVGDAMQEGKEVVIAPLPLYHVFSLTITSIMFFVLGGEVVLITNPRDLPSLIAEMKKTPYTSIVGINTLYNALLNKENFRSLDFSRLKHSIAGGMATQQAVADRWQKVTGSFIIEGYGLTETSPIITINPFTITEFTGSIGLPVPSTEVKFVDENNNEVAVGEVGELCVRGPQVMHDYWQQPEESKHAFIDNDWFRTGDMARMDENGFIYLVDRKKDMILVSGFNVYPNEIESVLASHPDIIEAAVIGVPDEESGEHVKAFIVRKNGKLTEDEVKAFCRENMTNYKRPREIEFRDELPKTPVGKFLRRELRDQEQQG